MDPRKLQFLQAVVGPDGAQALAKAAERAAELDQVIFPRAVVAWLENIAPFGFEGNVPGVEDAKFRFAKSEKGFDGMVTLNGELHQFEDASIDHLAGCVAVALGLDHERMDSRAKPQQLVKLGKSIDLLVKTQLVKTSWNAKMRRKYQFNPGEDKPWSVGGNPIPLDEGQVEDRRLRYARSIGLDPYRVDYFRDDFPDPPEGNKIPYNENFGVEHETAHAMMTPPGRTIEGYMGDLTSTATNPGYARQQLEREDYARHIMGQQQENIANQLEHDIDRRSGVDASLYNSAFRKPIQPLSPAYAGGNVEDPDFPVAKKVAAGNKIKTIFSKPIRNEAKQYSQKFDEGARFNRYGEIEPPTGIDAKINARAKAKLGKAAVKPNTGKKKINLPGVAAGPIAPKAPIPPTLTQPTNEKQMPAGAAGTAQTSPLPKLPKMPKPKATLSVTKSEAQRKCSHCMRPQFSGDKFKGCFCYAALSKSVKTINTSTGFTLEFGSAWDQDAILSLAETFRGK